MALLRFILAGGVEHNIDEDAMTCDCATGKKTKRAGDIQVGQMYCLCLDGNCAQFKVTDVQTEADIDAAPGNGVDDG